jgi:hypothetical protein
VAIAEIDEHQRTEIANAMNPAQQHNVRTDVLRTERAAGVRAGEI